MNELWWTVEFTLMMSNTEDLAPCIDGEMTIRGTDIFDVLDKASDRLKNFGYDRYVVHKVYGKEKGE